LRRNLSIGVSASELLNFFLLFFILRHRAQALPLTKRDIAVYGTASEREQQLLLRTDGEVVKRQEGRLLSAGQGARMAGKERLQAASA
jgi:hypothetical protein